MASVGVQEVWQRARHVVRQQQRQAGLGRQVNKHEKLLHLAVYVGRDRGELDLREHLLGAVAIRADGVIVVAHNGPAKNVYPPCHAEARILKKAGPNAILYVGRANRSGEWALAMPCRNCMRLIRQRHVRVVYYTVAPNAYEWITLS